jgi:hypothetical protein
VCPMCLACRLRRSLPLKSYPLKPRLGSFKCAHHAGPVANAPRQRHPGGPLPAVPGRGPFRAHTAPVRARPYPAPGIPAGVVHPARLWPPSTQLADHVNIGLVSLGGADRT